MTIYSNNISNGVKMFKEFLINYSDRNPKFSNYLTQNGFNIDSIDAIKSRRGNKFTDILLNCNLDLKKKFYKECIEKVSIWLPIELYKKMPIFYPYSIRGRRHDETSDNWGAANDEGWLIDDNSDVKDLIRGKKIKGTKQKLNKGYIACHIWPNTTKIPQLFTFVPNLVWLPSPIARLSDNEESLFSKMLKQFSINHFYNIQCDKKEMHQIASESWELLFNQSLHDVININFNQKNLLISDLDIQRLIRKTSSNITKIIEHVELLLRGKYVNLNERLIHSRYLPSLKEIIDKNPKSCNKMVAWLQRFRDAL